MNQHIIIGQLGANFEIFLNPDMEKGKHIAEELTKSSVWKQAYSGSLAELVTVLERAKQ